MILARYRLAVLDMDGTLLTDDKQITPRTAAAIRAAGERGVRIVLATARPFCSARPFAVSLGLHTPLVCYNGALVRALTDQATLATQPLPAGRAAEMAAFCRERGLYMKVYGDDVFYVEAPTAETVRYSPRYHVPFEAVGDMAAFIARQRLSPYLFVVHTRPEELAAVKAEMESLWAGGIAGDCPNEHAIHFTAAGVSKLAAVQALAARWDLAPTEIMAIGDGGNDLGLIKWAGLGIAMANSPAAIRREADLIAPSNNEEGVAQAIERFLLEPAGDTGGHNQESGMQEAK